MERLCHIYFLKNFDSKENKRNKRKKEDDRKKDEHLID